MSKCNYCAFYSVCTPPDWNRYFTELDKWDVKNPDTIFFGGGTPSLMPPEFFARLMRRVGGADEITIEANPATLTAEKLNAFIASGMNRLSVGIQSLDDSELQFLGRRHDSAAARELVRLGHAAGIRVSGDFIYRDLAGAKNICRWIEELKLAHASIYELTPEPGTPLADMRIDGDEMAAAYEYLQANCPLARYEISNYGEPCRHNQNVWDGEEYIGIGPTACGRVRTNGIWREQSYDTNWNLIINPLDDATRAREILMTGLRQTRGVKLSRVNQIIKLPHAQLQQCGERICATNYGLEILDSLLQDIMQ